MIAEYTCKNCGYTSARWHIHLSNSFIPVCENCFSRYTGSMAHICSFFLHRQKGNNKYAKRF